MKIVNRNLFLVILGLSLLAPSGCHAPRDAELELRLEAAKGLRDEVPASKGGGARRVASYSAKDRRAIMATIPGNRPAKAQLEATIQTAQGAIVCLLDSERAPQTVANFVALATGWKPWKSKASKVASSSPFYDELTFHRVIPNLMIQSGRVEGAPGWVIKREISPPELWKKPGVLAMVQSAKLTHGSKFFITLRDGSQKKDKDGVTWPERYARFGQCDLNGVVRTISRGKTHPEGKSKKRSTRPVVPVTINTVRFAWKAG